MKHNGVTPRSDEEIAGSESFSEMCVGLRTDGVVGVQKIRRVWRAVPEEVHDLCTSHAIALREGNHPLDGGVVNDGVGNRGIGHYPHRC